MDQRMSVHATAFTGILSSPGELSSSMGGLKLLTRVMNVTASDTLRYQDDSFFFISICREAWAIRAEQLSEEVSLTV